MRGLKEFVRVGGEQLSPDSTVEELRGMGAEMTVVGEGRSS